MAHGKEAKGAVQVIYISTTYAAQASCIRLYLYEYGG